MFSSTLQIPLNPLAIDSKHIIQAIYRTKYGSGDGLCTFTVLGVAELWLSLSSEPSSSSATLALIQNAKKITTWIELNLGFWVYRYLRDFIAAREWTRKRALPQNPKPNRSFLGAHSCSPLPNYLSSVSVSVFGFVFSRHWRRQVLKLFQPSTQGLH